MADELPKLVSRRANKKSTFHTGRVIGERREKLETASERTAAREKVKRKQNRRLVSTTIIYVVIAITAVFFCVKFFKQMADNEAMDNSPTSTTVIVPYAPTIEIIDEASQATGGHITGRMKEYIGQAEADFRELGYTPVRAVIPNGAIREVDMYLDGYTGYVKLTIDRGTGVSVEDADRMLRYLAANGVDNNSFEYIDVRIDGKAYWK